ncbi:MAG: hypothetical protein LC808_27485 [Actinobacteria bacterium]|nr:hypothetical protein [Actinomycetota bacterium]
MPTAPSANPQHCGRRSVDIGVGVVRGRWVGHRGDVRHLSDKHPGEVEHMHDLLDDLPARAGPLYPPRDRRHPVQPTSHHQAPRPVGE